MGDVLSLVEKAEEAMKEDEAQALTKRIMEEKFDFNDFLKQSKMMTGMGGVGNLTKMLPGKLVANHWAKSAKVIAVCWPCCLLHDCVICFEVKLLRLTVQATCSDGIAGTVVRGTLSLIWCTSWLQTWLACLENSACCTPLMFPASGTAYCCTL